MRRAYSFSAILCVLLAVYILPVFGCSKALREADLKESLRTTAERYWKLRLDESLEETYKMENNQNLPPFEKYRDSARAFKKINVISISVVDVNVTGEKGEVSLDWTYMLPKVTRPLHQMYKDEWTFEDGRWLHRFH